MEFYTEWRLLGDEHDGSFGNGSTLARGESVRNMRVKSEAEDCTVFEGAKGHIIKSYHKKLGNVIECKSVFENATAEPARLELLSSFAIKGIKADRIHRAASFWSAEGKLVSQDLSTLDMERAWASHGLRIEKFGQLGSMPVKKWFPFLVVENSESGDFLGVQLHCGSSWQIEIFRKDDFITIQGGIADRDYGHWSKTVNAGESFETPKAVVATGKSLAEVCDKLVKAQHPRIAEPDKDMPVIFNEYCTTWGNPTLENLRKTAKRLQGTGVRYLVIDSGWYKTKTCSDWFSGAGDWNPSAELFPNGIKEAADVISSYGLIPGIWFEFETCGSASKIYNKTDYLLSRDGCPVTAGGRRFLDMRKPQVWEYLDEKVLSLLKNSGFGYVKIDYNETIGVGVDGAESCGEGLRQSVEATRKYFAHLSDELPELVIENCSSGGHRLEPSFMELASMASFSDAHECNSIPLIAANLHRLIKPEQSQIWAVIRANADEYRINYLLTASFLGRLCLSGEIFDLTDEQWQLCRNAIVFYSRIKHIVKDGFTSVIDTNVKDYSKPQGCQIVLRELGNEALLIAHTFENGANPPVEKHLDGWRIKEKFGSDLNGDFRGCAYLLEK